MSVEKPIALLHSYLADREGKNRPDRLSRVNILAASELYRRGEIDKICITVEPELSSLLVQRLKTLLNDPLEEDLVIKPQTVTTAQEVQFFGDLAEEREWGNLITIGNHAHLPRIEREIQKRFSGSGKNIEAKSNREILSRFPRYESILNDMESWPEQLSLGKQEKILDTPLGKLALGVAPYLSRVKIVLQSWVFKLLEKK